MKSHCANIQKSARLKRILAELQAHRGEILTTAQLQSVTGSVAIHSDIHELRCNEIPVSDAIYLGKNDGRKVYGYKLEAV